MESTATLLAAAVPAPPELAELGHLRAALAALADPLSESTLR